MTVEEKKELLNLILKTKNFRKKTQKINIETCLKKKRIKKIIWKEQI